MRGRKPYSDEFKHEAVKLVREQGLPRRQVAADLGIDLDTLRRWLDDATSGTSANPPTSAPSSAELARLRRENELLRMERDILKKALGIFSRMPE
jgi:transposase